MHFTRRICQTIAVLICTMLIGSGCAGLSCIGCHGCKPKCVPAAPPVAPEPVAVTGLVANPQTLAMPATGMTLRQAVDAAGGPRLVEPETGKDWMTWAAIQKNDGPGGKTLYIPTSLITHTDLGDIRLTGGETIRVLNQVETALSPNAAGDPTTGISTVQGSEFSVRGFVRTPGTYRVNNVVTKQRLTSVYDVVNALADPGLEHQADCSVVLLTRKSSFDVGVAQFIIPIAGAYALPSPMNAAQAAALPLANTGAQALVPPLQPAAVVAAPAPAAPVPEGFPAPAAIELQPAVPVAPGADALPPIFIPPPAVRGLHNIALAAGDEIVLTKVELIPEITAEMVRPVIRAMLDREVAEKMNQPRHVLFPRLSERFGMNNP